MNKVILMGRLTRNPNVSYSQGQNQICVARYTLAVDRRFKKEGDQQTADFISCVAFGRAGEFAEKYFKQGMRITVSGRIQTGSYTNREGQKVYTTDVIIEEQEFSESKNAAQSRESAANMQRDPVEAAENTGKEVSEGFMTIPNGIEEELPFL